MTRPFLFPILMRGTNIFCALAFLLLLAACAERSAEKDPAPSTPSTQLEISDRAPPAPITMTPPRMLYTLTARSLGYQLELIDVRVVGDEVWTLAELRHPTGMVGMALEELELRAALPSEISVVRHFIVGAPQGIFEPPDGLFWLNSIDEMPPAWSEGQSVPQP